MRIFKFIYFFTLFFTCENNFNLPKPDAYLRIEFNEPKYLNYEDLNSQIDFYYNSSSSSINKISSKSINLNYENLGMSLDLSFNKLSSENEVINYITDFNLLLDTHTKRSNGFLVKEFENVEYSTFGKIYEFKGDVASPIQFFITDSLNNFIQGVVNKEISSKYDSIYPSIQYIKNDILVFFESINLNKNHEAK